MDANNQQVLKLPHFLLTYEVWEKALISKLNPSSRTFIVLAVKGVQSEKRLERHLL